MAGKWKQAALVVLLAVFLFSGGMVVRRQLLYRALGAERLEAAQIAGLTAEALTAQAPPAPRDSAPPGEPASPPEGPDPLADIDLGALRAVNGDVVGWIAIPGTELSYPLVQGADNRYYLSHNWKREASAGGAVFLESTNSGDLADFHTIIYAHQMGSGAMFGMLESYRDPEFWREHPSVSIALDGGVFRYDIFSAQKAGVRSIVYRLDLEESGLKQEFLQYCVDNSVVRSEVIPAAGDQILTLSTCTGNDRANRWVVHGVLRADGAAQ